MSQSIIRPHSHSVFPMVSSHVHQRLSAGRARTDHAETEAARASMDRPLYSPLAHLYHEQAFTQTRPMMWEPGLAGPSGPPSHAIHISATSSFRVADQLSEGQLDKFQSSWLVRVWERRQQIGAVVASLAFFFIGLSVALILFFWFQRVHKSYYTTELHRSCTSLGNLLSLDISTNLVTYADDLAGYFATISNVTEATITRFTSLAQDHSTTSDGISIIPVFAREQLPTFVTQFSNVRFQDGNDTFTRLGPVAPIALRLPFPPLRAGFLNPIGLNLFHASEYASTIRRTLGTGRPSLSLAEPGSKTIMPPNIRFWIMKGVQGVAVPNFPHWVMSFMIDSLRAIGRTLSSERVNGMAVRLVDNRTTSEYFSSSPGSSLLPTDRSVATFDVVDRQWTLTCTATAHMRSMYRTPWSWVLLFLLIGVVTVSAEIARRAVVRFLTAHGVARQVKHREGLVASLRMYSRAIVSTVRDPLIALDAFGYLVGSNKEALARLGIHGSSTSPLHISSLLPAGCIPASSSVAHGGEETTDSGDTVAFGPLPPGSYEIGMVGRPEAPFVAEATVSQLTGDKRGQVSQVLLLHDLTERIQALKSLQAAKDSAKAASVAKSQLLLLISHELRNPIYVINSLIEDPQATLTFGTPADDTELVAAKRIHYTTGLVADILGYLVELFADSTWTSTVPSVHGGLLDVRQAGPRQGAPATQLLGIANAALASVQPQLSLWDISVERWIEPEMFLQGPTRLVKDILAKVAYVIAHATQPQGQAVLELLVDQHNRDIRLYCRGEMWIPPQRSLQFVTSAKTGTRTTPSVRSQSTPWTSEQADAPEHVDSLTHAAIFLAMNAISAALGPNNSLWRVQYTPTYGGFDMTIPLGRVRAFSGPYIVPASAKHTAQLRERAQEQAALREEVVSIVPGIANPPAPTVDAIPSSPSRAVVSPQPIYPSPLSPNRLALESESEVAAMAIQAQKPCYTPPTPSESRCASPILSLCLQSPPSLSPNAPLRHQIGTPAPSIRAPLLDRMHSRRTLATAAATRNRQPSPISNSNQHLHVPTSPTRFSSSCCLTIEAPPSADAGTFQTLVGSHAITADLPEIPAVPDSPFAAPPAGPHRTSSERVQQEAQTHFSPLLPESPPDQPASLDPVVSVPTDNLLSPATLDLNPLLESPPRLPSLAQLDRASIVANRSLPDVPHAASPFSGTIPPHQDTALKRILVVEDNALVLRVTCKLVKTLGYEADTAMDGLECVKRMNDESKPKVDLILMDLVMPNMSGMDAMKTLRDAGFSKDALPIVAVTANALPEEREACMEAGFNEFVTKPLKKDILIGLCSGFLL